MPHTIDSDIKAFYGSVPPPPYSEHGTAVDIASMPHVPRPVLPEDKRNVHLNTLASDTHVVKFQTIVRDGKEIVVGRLKVPTPGTHTHAFILRRYDTNAISLTTMFKVAFPGATEEEESREMEWVRRSFDTSRTNGGRSFDAVRLAGQWVSRHLATYLAPDYRMGEIIDALATSVPDPNIQYRKSQRSQAAAGEEARPVPSLAADSNAPAPKRVRRQATDEPAPAPTGTDVAMTSDLAPTVANEDTINAEIAQAKQLVKELKRAIETREAQEDRGADLSESQRGTKRGQTSDSVVISGAGVGKGRIIKTNQRVQSRGDGVVKGGIKTVAYGSIILGIGLGLGALIPQLLG